MPTLTQDIFEKVLATYLTSGDFNGLACWSVTKDNDPMVIAAVRELIANRKIDAVFEDADPNPSVKRVGVEPVAVQLSKLDRDDIPKYCLYPTPEELSKAVGESSFSGRPYAYELALGAPQLEHRAFDLSVLEYYRNDPRYHYRCDDVHGTLVISDDFCDSSEVEERDKILIQSFGFAYSESFERAVAVFLCDLAGLSAEHQAVWRAKELRGTYRLHPDFVRTQFYAEFPDHIPIFSAFLMEMKIINKMAAAMGRPNMFREVPSTEKPPRRFGFLVRPTTSEFNDFVLTLDKLISDNICKDFFQGEVADEDEQERDDGKVVVRARGTLQLLEAWFNAKFRTRDRTPFEKMMVAFRRVRSLRQKPAHVLQDDVFDQKYIREQRELMLEAYTGIRTLRLLLANHPACANIEIHELLYQGKIRDF
jgi:hypothetical protein